MEIETKNAKIYVLKNNDSVSHRIILDLKHTIEIMFGKGNVDISRIKATKEVDYKNKEIKIRFEEK